METFIGEVSNIAFGGQGIVRQEGFVTFIPFTATGDKVRFEILQKKKNFAVGQLLEILQPSPQRTIPLCPYFGTCGGCQLQHINYAAQLEIKRQWIVDALQRQAGLYNLVIPPVIAAEQQWAYRRKIVLTMLPVNKSFVAGYWAIDQASLVEVQTCPIFVNDEIRIVEHVQTIIKEFISHTNDEGKASILKTENGQFLVHFHFKTMPKNAKDVLEKASKNYPEIKSLFATSREQTFKVGDYSAELSIESLNFEFSAKAFIQSHPEQSLNIYRAIAAYADKWQPTKVLDLYCGIGISSLLIAKHSTHVTGVEANAEAVKLATANAKSNQIKHVHFMQGYVEEVLQPLLRDVKPDLIIVNPPREGLHPQALQHLAEYKSKRMIYISCMPSTLARDLKVLCQAGYKVDDVQGYDMFPQTAHVETVVNLQAN